MRRMPTVVFTQQLARFVECPTLEVEGATLREALDRAFDLQPRLRGYVLDDQGAVRRHVAVFIDGQRVRDRAALGDGLAPGSRIHVLQALSGG